MNVDPQELKKFGDMAHRWWDPHAEFRPLHELNPLRLSWIDSHAQLTGKRVLDVGCGGGILSESMAVLGAQVTGIDLSHDALGVADLHSLESGVNVRYENISVEDLAEREPEQYDAVTCMEMLEHVPNPASVVSACAKLVKPGGWVFFSTLHRTPKSYLLGIIGAEYIAGLLPRGTHDYARFIRPSELTRFVRQAGLSATALKGMTYRPFTQRFTLSDDTSVNYMLAAHRPE